MPERQASLLFACIEKSNRSQMAEGFARTLGRGHGPILPGKHRLDWDLPDPKQLDDAGFRAIRDRIEALVTDLVAKATRPAPAQEEHHG